MSMKAFVVAMAAVLSVSETTFAAQKPHWVSFKSNVLNIVVSVPSDWNAMKIPKALAFHYDDLSGGTAGIGILKSSQIGNITEAADKEFQIVGRPADWIRGNATIGGMKAIKITGTDAKDPSKRIVHYYVETPNGVYIIQCLGTADRWESFRPVFTTILSKLKFL